MSKIYKGLILALLHVLIASSLGGKLLYDRRTLPRVWVHVAPVDPDLPIRGRYVRLQIQVPELTERLTQAQPVERVRLSVEENKLVVNLDERGRGGFLRLWGSNETARAVLSPPLAFFIPEHVPDPSVRPEGEELWAEVTVPTSGPPRPIQLGVKKNGRLTPLTVH